MWPSDASICVKKVMECLQKHQHMNVPEETQRNVLCFGSTIHKIIQTKACVNKKHIYLVQFKLEFKVQFK